MFCNFHSDYFDCRGSFQTIINSYCYIIGFNMVGNEGSCVGYFTFKIIDIAEACSAINALQKVNKQVH